MDLLNMTLKWNTCLKKIKVTKLLIERGLKGQWFLKNKKKLIKSVDEDKKTIHNTNQHHTTLHTTWKRQTVSNDRN